MTIYKTSEPQEFGNDWGLFVDVDIDDAKNNHITNHLDIRMEEEFDIENHLDCLKSENTKTHTCCGWCFKYVSILTKASVIAFIIFYVI
jgi:hypothetical protein